MLRSIPMKKPFKILLLACVGMTILGCVSKAKPFDKLRKAIRKSTNTDEEWKDSYGKIYKGISYGSSPLNTFDLYIPSQANRTHPQSVILCIHGGSWMGGSRDEMDYACKRYAKAGYITATLDYSLLRKDKPEITMLTMVDEIGTCLGQIKKTTARMGYKVNKAALYGFSAGGHLSLLYGFSRAKSSPLPVAFVSGQSFMAGIDKDSNTTKMSKQDAKKLLVVSPLAYIDRDTVPTLIASGAKDWLVPVDNGRKINAKLKKFGVPHVYVEFPQSGHELENAPALQAKYYQAMLQYTKKYFGY